MPTDTNPDPVKLLSDDEVAEIEARHEAVKHAFQPYKEVSDSLADIPALCATVCALRSRTAYDWADIIEKLQAENTALLERLAEAEQDRREALQAGLDRLGEIQQLQSQLAQVTQERDDLRGRQMITRDDALRFIQQYLHAAQWEGERLMITFENEALIAALIGDVDEH